jgi:lipoic acid synthetase
VKPDWLKIKLEAAGAYPAVRKTVEKYHLHTICSSGRCPNIGRCWNRGVATFMILGDICTRSCKFCATQTGKPLPPDPQEPQKIAESVRLMQLRHCVITSVDRDDLPDRGAAHWAAVVRAIREAMPHSAIETLIPDFDAQPQWLDVVLDAQPDIIGHNMETVERLTPQVRSRAGYRKSLDVLAYIARRGTIAKSGMMLGLGETPQETLAAMRDARRAGVRLFTIGQYLQPTRKHLPVAEYIPPAQFDYYRQAGLDMGFDHVASSPLVRSSYMAEEQYSVGSRQWAVGSRQAAVGSGQWAVSSGQSAVGSRQSAVGSRQSAVGRRQAAVGSRQSAGGSRQWAGGSGQPAVGSGRSAVGSKPFSILHSPFSINFVDWGLIDYREAWERQRALAAQLIAQKTAAPAACQLSTAPAHCPLPTATADCQPPTAYCPLPTATAHCQPPTAHCQLPTAACRLPTAACRLPTADCPLPPAGNTFVFCEHPHVYTLGRNGKANNLLVDAGFLSDINAAYYHVERGGDITYHGPGQIVGYPLLDLETLHLSLKQYIFTIEEMVIRTLQHYGLAAGRLPGATGVWLDAAKPAARKICAIGVHASRYVTTHGFALNVNTDLSYYRYIHPCGFTDKGVTSLAAEKGQTIEVNEVKQWLQHYFQKLTGISSSWQ